MSNIDRFENLKQIVKLVQPQFDELAKIHGAVNYKREVSFALQILEEKDYLASVAMKNQDSLRNAVLNVAAIGLSLSPVHKLAYLVPRDGKVCLDISYQGLKQLGVECGAIKFCKADLVYANDNFVLNGIDKEPLHEFKPFDSARGELVGGYCTAKTPDGDFITTIMEIKEIFAIRARSESYKKNSGPWISDQSEMVKKTLVRRGYKDWPKGTGPATERLAKAMQLEDDFETIDATVVNVDDSARTKAFEFIRESLAFLDRTEDKYIAHLATVNRREIKKIDDLTDLEIAQAKVMLGQWIDAKKQKEAANENANANQ